MKKILPILLLSLVAAASMQAHATPISTTVALSRVFAGTTPDGPSPWLVATFSSNTGTNTGTLTLTSHLTSPDFLQGLESSNAAFGWGFYLDTGIASIACASSPGTNCTTNVLSGGSYNGGPTGTDWNLAFGWPTQSRFASGDTAVYDITFSSNLTGSPFVANGANLLSAAHVQGISTGDGSGWIVKDPPANVPEPAVLGMFGIGTLMIGLFAGLRRRQH